MRTSKQHRELMVRSRTFRQIPHPGFPDGLNGRPIMLDMSGWCTECGRYLERKNEKAAIYDPGTLRKHSHPVPWRLGPKPRQQERS